MTKEEWDNLYPPNRMREMMRAYIDGARVTPQWRSAPESGDDALVSPTTADYLRWWYGLEKPAAWRNLP